MLQRTDLHVSCNGQKKFTGDQPVRFISIEISQEILKEVQIHGKAQKRQIKAI